MTMAATQQRYLVQHNTDYELMLHPATKARHDMATAAYISRDHIAKAVVVKDASYFALVVLAASSWLKMDYLRQELNRDLHLASEDDIANLFADCKRGSVPPLGPAYGIDTLLDESLSSVADVYFEAGDRKLLVRLRGERFRALLRGARRGYFSQRTELPPSSS